MRTSTGSFFAIVLGLVALAGGNLAMEHAALFPAARDAVKARCTRNQSNGSWLRSPEIYCRLPRAVSLSVL